MKYSCYKRCQILHTSLMLCLTGLLCLLWAGLPQTSWSTAPSNEVKVIGAVFPRPVDDWNDRLLADISVAMQEQGYQLQSSTKDMRLSEQIDTMRAFILNDVDCILLNPMTSSGWDDIVCQAAEANIPVVVLDHILTLAPETDTSLLYQITFDYEASAQSLAVSSIQNTQMLPGRQALILSGKVSSALSKRINAGLRAGFSQAGKFFPIYNSTSNEMQSKAEENVGSLLHNGYSFEVIYAHNSAMALGAIKTMTEYGIVVGKDTRIFAFGGGASLEKALVDGNLTGYVDCDTKAMTEDLLTLIGNLFQQQPPEAHELLISCQVIINEENGG